ncbi:Imm3 family immunity protein [Paenibacillus sp. JJ-223]|uniref:Imm3 family immunity protein n=1 Tax=Paenibacillus sp. JJ-223 TaxID=2905647 RepID=UPI001EEA83C5|nr:Imm3 family immunity protein [Paenibacillus sp. JJ-223]CAH1226391.1 hypothetical protein PAECIP111890_05918 [Paenibacillus sp. JJ-223]
MAWNYQELIESFIEECEGYKNINHLSHYEAVSQAFDENYSEKYSDEMEKAVLWIIVAELRLQQPRIYKNAKDNYIFKLKSINFQVVKEYIEKKQLTKEEFEDLYLRRNRVLVEIEKMPTDFCPKARWFYEEITDKVNDLFVKSVNIEETIDHVIAYFKSEFRNKACAKKIVFATIAENLMRGNYKVPDHVINEIIDNYIDNSQFELSQEESLDLLNRIDKILELLELK